MAQTSKSNIFSSLKPCITYFKKDVTHGLILNDKKEQVGSFKIVGHAIFGVIKTKGGEIRFEISDSPIVSCTDLDIHLDADMGQDDCFADIISAYRDHP